MATNGEATGAEAIEIEAAKIEGGDSPAAPLLAKASRELDPDVPVRGSVRTVPLVPMSCGPMVSATLTWARSHTCFGGSSLYTHGLCALRRAYTRALRLEPVCECVCRCRPCTPIA